MNIQSIPAQEIADYFLSLGPSAVSDHPALEELAIISGTLINLFDDSAQILANFLIGALIAARNPQYIEELLELIRTNDPQSHSLLLTCTKLTEALSILHNTRREG